MAREVLNHIFGIFNKAKNQKLWFWFIVVIFLILLTHTVIHLHCFDFFLFYFSFLKIIFPISSGFFQISSWETYVCLEEYSQWEILKNFGIKELSSFTTEIKTYATVMLPFPI